MTAGEPSWNSSGTLFEGIQRWSERKKTVTAEDATRRAEQAISWLIAGGVQVVRSHVDVTDPDLTALKALLELREKVRPWITVQLVAFPQEGILSFPRGAELLEEAVKMGADVVGAIPHFEHTREYGVQSIDLAVEVARRYDRAVDVHCDEIDDEQSRFVEVLATRALENKMGDRVVASHTTAMHSYNNAYAFKLFGLLRRAQMSFVANPLVNIHLQGRFDGYPRRRGLTRVPELLQAGVNVCFGHDDILDPWYPLGTGSLLQVAHMGLHACHMMGYQQIRDSAALVTANSARALGIQEEYGVEVGRPASFVVLPVEDWFTAIRVQPPVRFSVREGRLIAESRPAETTIHRERAEVINFLR
jgi:cytosine deaminase